MTTDPKKPSSCLHCTIVDAVNEWQKAHGEVGGEIVVVSLLHAMQQVMRDGAGLPQYPEDAARRPGEPVH